MSDDKNVVPLKQPAPQRQNEFTLFAEFALNDTSCGLQLTLTDDAGDTVAVVDYSISGKSPENFDLSRLVDAWSRWRGYTGLAS